MAARRRRRSCAGEGLLERGNHSIRSEFRGPNSAGESATHRRGCACAGTSRHELGRALHALRDEPEQGLLLYERLVRLIGLIMTFVESCPSGSRMGSVTGFGVGLNGAAADWPAGMCAYGRRPWPGDAGELFGLGGGRVFHGALVGSMVTDPPPWFRSSRNIRWPSRPSHWARPRSARCPRASRTYLQEVGAADFWMCSLLLGLAGQLSAQRLDLAGRWQPRLQVARLPASAAMVPRGPTASVERTPGGPGWPPRRRKI